MDRTWWNHWVGGKRRAARGPGARLRAGPQAGTGRRARPPWLEPLEVRCVLDIRSVTGFGNNLAHPTWGQSGTDLLRVSPVAYADGISAPSQPNALSPRAISNNLSNQSDPIFSGADNLGLPQSRSLSAFAYVWGQFIDHDMDLTPTQSGANPETFDIPADPTRPNDPMGVESFTRSVFDPNTGASNWYLRNENSPGAPDAGRFAYGAPGWVPVVGDWNGDGTTTLGVVDPRTMTWYLRNANSAGSPDVATPFRYGLPGWVPVVGDWTGSGHTGIGAFDPSTGTWYLRNEDSPGAPDAGRFAYGAPGWVPVVGDWDGNGTATVGVFDPATATWYLRNENSGGAPDAGAFQFGAPGWVPVVGDWTGSGHTGIGAFDPSTGTSNPRQQINAITSFLDLSQVYGSTQVVADALRTFSGGHLKTSPGNLLPFNNTTYFTPIQLAALSMDNDAQQVPDANLFAAGDERANENIELTAMTTLFVRNHNRLADQLHALNPTWTDEQLYQEARELNIAAEEIITYTEFLPATLGPNALPAYNGYNPNVNPGIATEFSTVAFRFGHSLLDDDVGRHNNDGTEITDVNPDGAEINLTEDFYRPDLINPNGVTVNLVDTDGDPDPHTASAIGAILKANADEASNEMDLLVIDEVRNVLFGIPNAPGTDLIARDLQRARDHGIGTYNQVRVAYGLPAVTSFAQITSDVLVQQELQATYGTVDKVDALEGLFAEDHVPGGDVGPTIKAVLADQFQRLRDGDRFFYLNESFDPQELSLIRQGNTLAEVIADNTAITNLQGNVFFFKEEISGHVFVGPDGNGIRGDTEPGLPGITVNLLDDSGDVVASTTTDATGGYDFTDQTGIPGTGDYILSLTLPPTLTQTAAQIAHNPGTIHLSRGGLNFDNQDFAVLGTPVNFLNGFAGTAGLQRNGSAQVSGSRLRLTDGGGFEAGSVFTTSPVSIGRFSTFFSFQLSNANADGFTFTIQRQAPTALGSSGGGLGYATDGTRPGPVISPSAALKFDLFNNQGEGPDSTGLYFNGAPPTVRAVDLSNTGINLHSGDPFAARINYDGSTLTLRITDENTGAQVEVVFRGVNIPAAIGGTTAFVGFTGGTGGLTAAQDIRAWNYTAIVNPSAASPALAGGGTPVPVATPVASAAPAPAAVDGLSAPNATLVNIVVGQSQAPAGTGTVVSVSAPPSQAAPPQGPPADLTAAPAGASGADATLVNVLVQQPQAPAGTGSVVSVSAPVPRAPDAGVTGLAARAVASPGMPADPASSGDALASGGALSDVVGAAQAGTLDTNQLLANL